MITFVIIKDNRKIIDIESIVILEIKINNKFKKDINEV